MSEDQDLLQAIGNLNSKDVKVLRKSLAVITRLQDVRAIKPLIDLWCDNERWTLLANEPEDWDALHVIQKAMIAIGPPAVPALLANLERDFRFIYVLPFIADDTAADGLLTFARKSKSNMDVAHAAWTRYLVNREIPQSRQRFTQQLINGYIDMVCDESIRFWESTAQHLYDWITLDDWMRLLNCLPDTRKQTIIAAYNAYRNKR